MFYINRKLLISIQTQLLRCSLVDCANRIDCYNLEDSMIHRRIFSEREGRGFRVIRLKEPIPIPKPTDCLRDY